MNNLFKRFKKIIAACPRILFGKAALVRYALANKRGESYVDTAIKILIAVVLGALILAGLYALFGNTVLPTLVQRITDMFNYSGI